MTTTTVAVRSCGRCGAQVSPRDKYCKHCGVVRIPPAEWLRSRRDISGLLVGTIGAPSAIRGFAVAIDIACSLVIALLVVALGRWTGAVFLTALLAFAIALIVQLVILSRRGQTLGRGILGLRTVDDLTGLPPRGRFALMAVIGIERSTVTLDLRRGRDPLEPLVSRLSHGLLASTRNGSPESEPSEHPEENVSRARVSPPADDSDDERPADGVTIIFDSGQRLTVDGTIVIGRNPDAAAGPVFALPDLSRSLSKNHVKLEWSGTVLWITDLASTNGTTLVSAAGRHTTLLAGKRASASVGSRIELGNRSFMVNEAVHR
jgi:RDD family protein/FHA domain-containing protein